MSARSAFADSVNTVAVQIADTEGIPAVVEVVRKLGVQSDLPAVPTLAFGSAEVMLLEMTQAFAAIHERADRGERGGEEHGYSGSGLGWYTRSTNQGAWIALPGLIWPYTALTRPPKR